MEVWRREVEVFRELRQAGRPRSDEKACGAILFSYSFQMSELCCVKISLFEPPRKSNFFSAQRPCIHISGCGNVLEKSCNQSLVWYVHDPGLNCRKTG